MLGDKPATWVLTRIQYQLFDHPKSNLYKPAQIQPGIST